MRRRIGPVSKKVQMKRCRNTDKGLEKGNGVRRNEHCSSSEPGHSLTEHYDQARSGKTRLVSHNTQAFNRKDFNSLTIRSISPHPQTLQTFDYTINIPPSKTGPSKISYNI